MNKILIVEDDADMIELLRIVFRSSGYDVTFSSMAPDVDHIIELRAELIVLDVRLKGSPISGADLCKRLKSNPNTKQIPVILASAEYNLAEIAKDCNADLFLAKPYDMLSLLLSINRFLL